MTVLPTEPTEPDSASELADRDQLERGLRRLNDAQRTILTLNFYVGLSPAETAEALDIPVGTAKSRLHSRSRRCGRRWPPTSAPRLLLRGGADGMSSNRDLESRIADFYAQEGLLRAPDRVLSSALTTIESTRQRRVFGRLFGRASWRFPDVSNYFKVAVAAVVVIAALGVGYALYSGRPPAPGATIGPSPSPVGSALPAGEPLTETFTSALHGMSVDYPAGSIVEPGLGPWTTSLPGADDPPSRDTIWIDQDENLFVGLASQPLAGRSSDEWIAEIAADPEWGDTCDTADTQTVTVDGASGVVALCPERVLNALVTDDERGYFIIYYGSDDRARFDEILSTVQLEPGGSALPALTGTYTSDVHGITVSYPGEWTTRPATEPWVAGDLTLDAAFADSIVDASDDPAIVVTSQPLNDKTPSAWAAEFLSTRPCGVAERYTIAGVDGVITECEDGHHAVVSVEERAYVIWLYRIVDIDYFKEILGTVELDPGSALISSDPFGVPFTFRSPAGPRWDHDGVDPTTFDWRVPEYNDAGHPGGMIALVIGGGREDPCDPEIGRVGDRPRPAVGDGLPGDRSRYLAGRRIGDHRRWSGGSSGDCACDYRDTPVRCLYLDGGHRTVRGHSARGVPTRDRS